MVPLQGNESQIAEGIVKGFFEALNENILVSVKRRYTSHILGF